MSPIKIKVHPAGPHVSADSLARTLAVFLLVATVLIVLFAGTFPFDFSIPPGGMDRAIARDFDTRWMQYDPGNIDRGQNVLFFLPFGFALASVIRPRQQRWIWQLLLSIPIGGALSTIVEVSQVLVSFRDPSLQDVWCNTLGGLLGAGIFVLIGDKLLMLAAQGLLHLRRFARPAVLGTALALYAVAQLVAPLIIRKPGDLSVWAPGMPLNIGNEPDNANPDERHWQGSISNLVISDRAATEDEAVRLYHGDDPSQIFGQSLVARYRLLGGQAPYADDTGLLPPLTWATKPPDQPVGADQPAQVDFEHWLSTGTPIAKGIFRIGQTSELTVAATIFAARTDLHGPARIVNIATGPTGHNFTIGQEYKDLTIRVRSALRQSPDLHVHDLFFDERPHHIVVTHKQAQIVAYVDGYEAGRVEITPEAKVIWRIYPRNWFRIRIEKYGYRSYAAIYRLLVFIPFAALLSALLSSTPWMPRKRYLVGAAIVVAMSMVLESLLGTESASGFQVRNLIISLIVGFAALGAMMLRPKRARRFGQAHG